MDVFDEHIEYGLTLARYSIWIVSGLVLATVGPALSRWFSSTYVSGSQAAVTVIGNILFQVIAAIVAGAGFFGGIHRLLEDSDL